MVVTTVTVAVLLIISSVIDMSEADHKFRANLYNGVSDYYIRSGSGISWVNRLYDPGPGSCNVRGTIRIPFSSGDCYKFRLYLNSNPSKFNFHIDNGRGDGWGGTSWCYEVHNYDKNLKVYGRTGSGDSTFLDSVVTNTVTIIVRKGQVQFYGNNNLVQTVINPTLFTSSSIYFSMNRVYNLNAFPNPLRVGTGLCRVYIYKTCS
jgi:hypothetical protein